MVWWLKKFMKSFHSNKVNGWKNILVLMLKIETKLKMILRKTSLKYLLMPLLVKFQKTFEIDRK